MENLSSQWAGRLRRLLIAVLLPTLTVACAGDDVPQYREDLVALQVEEDFELRVEEPTDGFLDTVGRDAKVFADAGSKGTAVVGCVAGGLTLGLTLAAIVPPASEDAFEVGCEVGGLVLLPVGFALGYSTGAVVGTVRGATNLFVQSDDEIDTKALLTAIESATPRIDLANSVIEQSQRGSLASLVWTEGPSETGHSLPQTVPEPAFQLTLTITRLRLTTTTSTAPNSRLYLAVKGELTDARTGEEFRDGSWRYVSEPLSTAEIADNGADALKAELAGGWRKLADEIIDELFGPERR